MFKVSFSSLKKIFSTTHSLAFPNVSQRVVCCSSFCSIPSNKNGEGIWKCLPLDRVTVQTRTFCNTTHIVEMRGLDTEAREEDVRDFFRSLNIVPASINLHCDNSGRVSGACEIHFATHADAVVAMRKKNSFIGHRFVRLKLKSSSIEQEVCNNRNKDGVLPEGAWSIDRTSSHSGHFVRMKGLSTRITEQAIFDFFWPLNIHPISTRQVYDDNGRRVGEFDVEFLTHVDAVKAMTKNNAYLGCRFVELILNSQPNSADKEGTETENVSMNMNHKSASRNV